MSDFTLLTTEQECQTVLQCTPHILAEDGTALVQSTNVCQTEITIESTGTDVDLQAVLGYLPPEKIAHDAVGTIAPGRKIKIQFALPNKSIATSDLPAEQLPTEVDTDGSVTSEHSVDYISSKCGEEVNAKIYPILKKTVGRSIPTESVQCQTALLVYPHFLKDDECGTVTAETSIQTDFSFTPQSSLSNILPKLKSYLHHEGRVIDCGDGFKNQNVISFIRELLGDIVNMHENLFDPDCILPEVPLALDVGKSTCTNTEINSSSISTNTVESDRRVSATTSPFHSALDITISPIRIIESDSKMRSKYLFGSLKRPTCDCCKYSPCCSDLDINLTVERQPFDKCCSKNGEAPQIQPANLIIKELLDETIETIIKSVPNIKKPLVHIGSIDYAQQFDMNVISGPPTPPNSPTLQTVPYLNPNLLEEIIKDKINNLDPFKFCSDVGTQCDCNKENKITKLIALPSTTPDLNVRVEKPTIIEPTPEKELPLQDVEPVLENKPLHSKVLKKLTKKIYICNCSIDGKSTVGCFCSYKHKEVTAEVNIPIEDIYYPRIKPKEPKENPNLKAIKFDTQEKEEPKNVVAKTNENIPEDMKKLYEQPKRFQRPQSIGYLIEPAQAISTKPSKTVTIQDNNLSLTTIPLKKTHENINLVCISCKNSCCLKPYKEDLNIDLINDTDEETDDDYKTATSSPTTVKNLEEVDKNVAERKTSREEMMKLLLELKIIDSSANQQQQEEPITPKVPKKNIINVPSTKSICKNPQRKKNYLNVCKMADVCSAFSSKSSLKSGPTSQSSKIVTIIARGLMSNFPSVPALHFVKNASRPSSTILKKEILNSQPVTTTNSVRFTVLKDDDTNIPKTYTKCLPSCSEHIIATNCLDYVKVKKTEPETNSVATGMQKSSLKVCAATGTSKPVSLNSSTICKTFNAQERVISAVKTCESQLQPLRDAFIDLKQKLKQLNIPEVNCIFEANEIDQLIPKSSKKCKIQLATQPDPYNCGFHTTQTKFKFIPPRSHSNMTEPSRASSRQSCRSFRSAHCYYPNNYPYLTQRCSSASPDWKRYYSCLLQYDDNAPCLRRPYPTHGMMQNKGFQTSNTNSYCSLNVARTEENFNMSNNASRSNFSHVSSDEFQECPNCNNYYYYTGYY